MQLPGFSSPVRKKYFPNWRKIFLQLATRLHLHCNGKWLSYVETQRATSQWFSGWYFGRHCTLRLYEMDTVEMPDHVRQDTGGEYVPHFDMSFFYAFNLLNKRRKEPFLSNLSKNIFKKSWRKSCQFKIKAYLCTRNRESDDGCESDLWGYLHNTTSSTRIGIEYIDKEYRQEKDLGLRWETESGLRI